MTASTEDLNQSMGLRLFRRSSFGQPCRRWCGPHRVSSKYCGSCNYGCVCSLPASWAVQVRIRADFLHLLAAQGCARSGIPIFYQGLRTRSAGLVGLVFFFLIALGVNLHHFPIEVVASCALARLLWVFSPPDVAGARTTTYLQ
jgi:hypothetical protein